MKTIPGDFLWDDFRDNKEFSDSFTHWKTGHGELLCRNFNDNERPYFTMINRDSVSCPTCLRALTRTKSVHSFD